MLARILLPVPEAYGDFIIVLYIVTMMRFSGALGIGTALRKMLPGESHAERRRELVSGAILLGVIISGALTVAIMLFGGTVLSYVYAKAYLTEALMVAALSIFLVIMFNVLASVLIASNGARRASIANVLNSALQLVLATALVLLGYGIVGAFIGIVTGNAIGCLMQAYYILKGRLASRRMPLYSTMGRIVHFALPLFISEISSVWVSNFAVAFLGVFVSAAVIANYGVAYKLGTFVTVLLSSSIFVLIPVFSSAIANKSVSAKVPSIYRSSVYYSLLAFLPILAFAIGSAKPLIFVLFSKSYTLAPIYFIVIVAGSMATIFGNYAGALIVSYGDTKRFLKYQLTVLGIGLVSLVALTPTLGVLGVLLSLFVITPIALGLVYTWALRTQFHSQIAPAKTARLIL